MEFQFIFVSARISRARWPHIRGTASPSAAINMICHIWNASVALSLSANLQAVTRQTGFVNLNSSMIALVILRDKVFKPLLASSCQRKRGWQWATKLIACASSFEAHREGC
jgi:hypothetical protein